MAISIIVLSQIFSTCVQSSLNVLLQHALFVLPLNSGKLRTRICVCGLLYLTPVMHLVILNVDRLYFLQETNNLDHHS